MKNSINIILVTVDCLRLGHVGCYGYNRNTTPNIDKLARKGVLFTNAIAQGPSTAYSFPSILASTFPLKHLRLDRLRDTRIVPRNVLFNRECWSPPQNTVTLAEILRKNNYYTLGFNSQNPFLSRYFGYDKGFDVFEDIARKPAQSGSSAARNRRKRIIRRTKGMLDRFSAVSSSFVLFRVLLSICLVHPRLRPPPYRMAQSANRNVLKCLAEFSRSHVKDSKGFFLWLHYMDPHAPYLHYDYPIRVSKRMEVKYFWSVYKTKHIPESITEKDIDQLKWFYDWEVRYADSQIGFLLDELKTLGVTSDNSVIILTSDHGDEFAEHGRFFHTDRLYDELTHVPLIICGPNIPRDTTINSIVGLIDLPPTILELAGSKIPTAFEGETLVPLLDGKADRIRDGIVSECLTREGGRKYSYRTEEFKYIYTITNHDAIGEFYNLRLDPGEKMNVVHGNDKSEDHKSHVLEHISAEEKIGRAWFGYT